MDEPSSSQTDATIKPSAFGILLRASRRKTCLSEKIKETNEKEKLKNDLIDWLQTNGVGWSLDENNFLGKQFINTLSMVLWEIDGNHKALSDRGCALPLPLVTFSGYNIPELRKKRKISVDSLMESTISANVDSLIKLTTQAYMKYADWRSIRECILGLATN